LGDQHRTPAIGIRNEGFGVNDDCAAADLPPIELVTSAVEMEAVDALLEGAVVVFLGETTRVVEYPNDLVLASAVVLPDFTDRRAKGPSTPGRCGNSVGRRSGAPLESSRPRVGC
jgi:hypothetical protein